MAGKRYCENCGVTHTALMCFHKPRKPLKIIVPIKTHTTLNPKGPKTDEWLKTRKAWVKANPPDHSGYWYCSYCGKALKKDEMTLDHIWPRTKRGDLIHEFSNLTPACYDCNRRKGSKNPENFPAHFAVAK